MTSGQGLSFSVATYNIHHGLGCDGRYDLHRTAEVLREMNADVLGLQEVDTGLMVPLFERRRHDRPSSLPKGDRTSGELHQLDFLCRKTGYQAIEGFVSPRHGGEFGNVLLTRHTVQDVTRIDLTVRGGWARRGAIDVKLLIHGQAVRVIVAHLGLLVWERHFQISRLLKVLGTSKTEPLILIGDFNLLLTFFSQWRRFSRRLGHTPLVRTFPSWFPILPLDRIWAQPASSLVRVARYDTPKSRLASDHLPLAATIRLP